MPDPQATILELIYGRWRSQILYAGVKLGIFDVLSKEPMTATEIAQRLALDPVLTYRLLRALGSLGLLQEHHGRRFTLGEAGQVLRSDHPQTLRGVALLAEGPEHYAVWKHLSAIVRDGKQDGFVREFGHTAFEHAARERAYEEAFDAGMSSYSRMQASWVLEALHTCDFTAISHLCDVGGGQGYLLCQFLLHYQHLSGTVLERPGVLANNQQLWAERLNVGDRCDYVAGDMFVDVPIADAYIMKMILHDWNDEECIQILRTMYKRVAPAGRVFIVEHVIPEIDTPHFAKLFDIHMMCWGTGRERTVEEYAALLQSAGWQYVANWLPSNGAVGVVEGAKLRL